VNLAINIRFTVTGIFASRRSPAERTRVDGGTLLPLRDPVQASNEFCSQLGLAGADKEKNDDTQQRTQIQDS